MLTSSVGRDQTTSSSSPSRFNSFFSFRRKQTPKYAPLASSFRRFLADVYSTAEMAHDRSPSGYAPHPRARLHRRQERKPSLVLRVWCRVRARMRVLRVQGKETSPSSSPLSHGNRRQPSSRIAEHYSIFNSCSSSRGTARPITNSCSNR